MSLFQCPQCGCMENTALAPWTYPKPRICSACAPKSESGKGGEWHGRFERIFLPMGMFVTDDVGNLAHKETGDTDVRKYQIPEPT